MATMRLFRALRKNGFQVGVTLQKAKREDTRMEMGVSVLSKNPLRKAQYVYRHILERELVKPYSNKLFSTGLAGNKLSGLPGVRKADILHLHWVNDNFLSLRSLMKVRKPIVWTMHDMWPFTGGLHYMQDSDAVKDPKQLSEEKIYEKLWELKLNLYKDINLTMVSPSNWLAELARQSPLLHGKRVEVIPNPIDTKVYASVDKEAARASLGLDQSKINVLFGSFNVLEDKRKGFPVLKEALHSVAKNRPDLLERFRLIVLGRPNEALVNELPFEVRFTGFKSTDSDIVNCYNAADVFVLPSLQDNLPNMCLEAIACGLPVLAFDLGGIPDMVENGKNGFLVKPEDSSALANSLVEMIDNEGLRQDMQAASTVKAQEFSQERVALSFEDLYGSLV